jgi:Predicted membrane protein
MMAFLIRATEYAVVAIDMLALLVIVAATALAFGNGVRAMVTRASQHEMRLIWLHYARWLVAALTLQLAADIVETSIRTDWQSIGRLAAVAVIRTFLNYFLERDLGELREREAEA